MVRALPPPNACPVCGVERARHLPCAVCFATNAHTKLGPSCKRDPVNDGWIETWEDFGAEEDVAGNDRVRVTHRLYELADRPIKDEKPRVRAILRCFSSGTMTMRQIAAACGCSKSLVVYVYRTRMQGRARNRNALKSR